VLDLSSGAADVSMLVARIVGPAGQVVGVERSPGAIESAQARAGIGNDSFL
jgi:ubiquinone/menaquinone biosynthesis C-methylase UbiE